MTSILDTIIPKSDQLNFDDFAAGQSKTIKITKVSLSMGDQPATINYEGDNGKPWKPSKGMRRVLVHIWGPDASKYVGKSLTLYGDPKVVFGGAQVGGIRISNMSDITEPVTLALTATRASRKPFTVKPLVVAAAPKQMMTDDESKVAAVKFGLRAEALKGMGALEKAFKSLTNENKIAVKPFMDEFKQLAAAADTKQVSDQPEELF